MRQNSDSPSIIMLQEMPFSSSMSVACIRRLDIRLRQSANFLDSFMNIVLVVSDRSFDKRDRLQELILVFKTEFARTVRVDKGPKLAETTLIEAGVVIVLTTPIPGAPGRVLMAKPPKYADATVPRPVIHSTSHLCAIFAASMLVRDSPIASVMANDSPSAPAPLVP